MEIILEFNNSTQQITLSFLPKKKVKICTKRLSSKDQNCHNKSFSWLLGIIYLYVFRLSFHELRGSVFTAYFIFKKKNSPIACDCAIRLERISSDSIVHRESIRSRDWQRFLHENINTLVHIPIYNVGACFFLSPYRLAGFFPSCYYAVNGVTEHSRERDPIGDISI